MKTIIRIFKLEHQKERKTELAAILSALFFAIGSVTAATTTAAFAAADSSSSSSGGSSSGSSDSSGSGSSGGDSGSGSGSSSDGGGSGSSTGGGGGDTGTGGTGGQGSQPQTPTGTTPTGTTPTGPPTGVTPLITTPPTIPLPPTKWPSIPDNCKYVDDHTKVVCHHSGGGGSSRTTVIKYLGGGYTGGAVQSSGIVMLPSTAKDFANNEPKTLTLDFVNPTGPDSIGNYWVKGEVVSNGNSTLQNLKITAHWFDAGNKIIGVTYGYTDKLNTNLNSGDRSTFSIMADGHNDLIGIPRFVQLSYDWQ